MTLLRVEKLTRDFRAMRAVDGVSFDVAEGEIVGMVGESGCGKTTTARCITRLIPATSGTVWLGDVDVTRADRRGLRAVRRAIKMVFQDPFASLNPRMTAGQIVAEGLGAHGIGDGRAERRAMASDLMDRVGLDPDLIDAYPRAFSGGQRQRIGIARALAVRPRLLICDEAVSALDVSIQAQICNLLLDLRDSSSLSILFIAHDLAVVRQLCDRVVVMNGGRVVESGDTDKVFTAPADEYTRALLAATPRSEGAMP